MKDNPRQKNKVPNLKTNAINTGQFLYNWWLLLIIFVNTINFN